MFSNTTEWSSLWPGLAARCASVSFLLVVCWSALYWAIH